MRLEGHLVLQDREKGLSEEHHYFVDLNSMNYTSHPQERQVNIYTDGSLTENHAGAGYVTDEAQKEITTKSLRLSRNSTVFQAEIIAIRNAAKD